MAGAWAHLYNTARWHKIRARQKRIEPLCRLCAAAGKTTAATICDHIQRHMGDEAKFYAGPFQSLCKDCHDCTKRQLERSGTLRGCDESGKPYGRADW